MAFFKEKTITASPGKQNAIIMGRKTWFSLPEHLRPLSGRINIVLTTTHTHNIQKNLSPKKSDAVILNLSWLISHFHSLMKDDCARPASFVVKQAEEYADYLIIKSALEIEKRSQCVVVVGEDIDFLVIIAASTNSENIFFLKPGRGEEEIYQSSEPQQVVNIFRDENACPGDIDEAGKKVLIALYGRKKSEETRDSLIFKLFQKSLVKNNFILVFLPPTTAAAREHSPCIPAGSTLQWICQKAIRLVLERNQTWIVLSHHPQGTSFSSPFLYDIIASAQKGVI
ncbi:hypothetical protein AVEN_168293-1 [Araneus ventricosus]|uniref:dihydrofolate reductase n=1 Tax=Araneus ventricosus TaxID=182803 RepID=A0A4Y2U1W5_ARAVE|nr:hypothetical protein AVEN_168293-1 [Araneus ventricosus]